MQANISILMISYIYALTGIKETKHGLRAGAKLFDIEAGVQIMHNNSAL